MHSTPVAPCASTDARAPCGADARTRKSLTSSPCTVMFVRNAVTSRGAAAAVAPVPGSLSSAAAARCPHSAAGGPISRSAGAGERDTCAQGALGRPSAHAACAAGAAGALPCTSRKRLSSQTVPPARRKTVESAVTRHWNGLSGVGTLRAVEDETPASVARPPAARLAGEAEQLPCTGGTHLGWRAHHVRCESREHSARLAAVAHSFFFFKAHSMHCSRGTCEPCRGALQCAVLLHAAWVCVTKCVTDAGC